MAIETKRGWDFTASIKHTVPMLRVFVYGMAQSLVKGGRLRPGIGLLTQFGAYLRPSEMQGLVTTDVVLPEMAGAGAKGCYLLLGMSERGTKVRREQTAQVYDPYVIAALRFLIAHTRQGEKLFPFTAEAYASLLRAHGRCLGLSDLGFTPHSPRAGAATQDRMDGVPFSEVQERGRWLVAASLRIYLDRAMALAQATVRHAKDLLPLLENPSLMGTFFRLAPLR
jgi:hypothetical protein